jgi:hypothetical protein
LVENSAEKGVRFWVAVIGAGVIGGELGVDRRFGFGGRGFGGRGCRRGGGG